MATVNYRQLGDRDNDDVSLNLVSAIGDRVNALSICLCSETVPEHCLYRKCDEQIGVVAVNCDRFDDLFAMTLSFLTLDFRRRNLTLTVQIEWSWCGEELR